MPTTNILALVLAGGEGSRLHPLTAERSKPAVPFSGHYRIVDFVLSNCINSRVYSIYLLVQYKSQSLIEHLSRAWVLSPLLPGHFITVVPPQMLGGPEWFQGTADAVYQNLNLVHKHCPEIVAVFGADHIYRMDLRQMADFHRRMGADVSVAALPVPLADARDFGVIGTDAEGRIIEFAEKPAQPKAIPGDPQRAYASLGNYLFSTEVLIDAIEQAHDLGEKDFGKHVIPRLMGSHKVVAYDFSANCVRGLKPYEQASYWRDVGTIGAYWNAHQDLLGEQPPFDLFNPLWPIRSGCSNEPVMQVVRGDIENSLFGPGSVMRGRHVRNSVIRSEVLIEPDVTIEDSVIMDYVVIKRGSKIRRAIIDRYNVLPEGTTIGYDREADRRRYHVDEASGVVVLGRSTRHFNPVY